MQLLNIYNTGLRTRINGQGELPKYLTNIILILTCPEWKF